MLDPGIYSIVVLTSELGTFEWWILVLMLDPLFILISRLNNSCSPLVVPVSLSSDLMTKPNTVSVRHGSDRWDSSLLLGLKNEQWRKELYFSGQSRKKD